MRHVRQPWVVTSLVVLGFIQAAFAESSPANDIALLAGKGLGEEVLLAYVDRVEGNFALSADQVVKLKEAGVPERVIAAMLRKKAPETSQVLQVPARSQVIYRTERTTATEPLTTLVYQPNPSYAATYYPSTSYYYPSSYYASSYYYPSSYRSSYYASSYYYPSSYYARSSYYPSSYYSSSCYYPSSYYSGYSSPSFYFSLGGSCRPSHYRSSSWGHSGGSHHRR